MYTEASARIKYESGAFLNAAARVSRDLSVAVVKHFASTGSNQKLLDATTATGIRAIRYAKEADAGDITALDINPTAWKAAKANIRYNKIKANVINTGIQEFANSTEERFDIIDLDPFGSPAPNIFDIMKICMDGTLLMATATDTGVLAGAQGKACLKVYDAKPMHNELCNEVGLRILSGYIARVAAQFNFGVMPMLYLRHRNHMRVFIKIMHGAAAVNDTLGKVGYAYYCEKCGTRYCKGEAIASDSRCKCGEKMRVAGKLWCGPMKDNAVARRVADLVCNINDLPTESKRAAAMLRDEIDVPLYYHVPTVTQKLHGGSVPIMEIIESLRSEGYLASRTHVDDNGVKTNASSMDFSATVKQLGKHRK